MWFARKVAGMVGEARERGVSPESPEAAEVLDRLLGAPDAARRAQVLARLEEATDEQAARYVRLLAAVKGEPVPPSPAAEYRWLVAALRAHG
jgi:hypothetical protein